MTVTPTVVADARGLRRTERRITPAEAPSRTTTRQHLEQLLERLSAMRRRRDGEPNDRPVP
jgi:hypothetical protein